MEEVLACRACLATGVKLHNMHSNNLVSAYENLTGYKMIKSENFPEHMCTYCTTMLLKSVSFKDKCKRAMDVLNSTLIQSGMVTPTDILNIDRQYNKLALPYKCHSQILIKEEVGNEQEESTLEEMDNDGFGDEADDADTSTTPETKDIKDIESSEDEPLSLKVEKKKCTKDVLPKHKDFENVNIELITLTKEEQIQEVLARKLSVNYQNSLYKCDKCFKGFITDVTYKNHMYRHDPSAGPHSCEVCHTYWVSARALRSHVVAAHARKFVCRACEHVTRSVHRAREHAYWHNGHTFRCKVCGAVFAKSTSYLTHLRLQHPSKHRCELCGESFLGVNGLNIHKKKAHRVNQTEEFVCSDCKAVFHNREALEFHESQRLDNLGCEIGLKPCSQCGQSYLTEERLQEHVMMQHRVDALKCLQCDRTFAHKRSIAVHYQRVHLGVKTSPGGDARKKLVVVCEICGLKCISKASLVHHQRIHSGEKPFQCPECPKKFSVCQRLQIHLRTHTGERPFKCHICPKAFKHKAALNRHDRVHTGAKPYACLHCGKSFSQSNSMKLHVRTVHLHMPAPYRARRNTTAINT